jgi:peptidyl-prolyl cis-trans isomerase C
VLTNASATIGAHAGPSRVERRSAWQRVAREPLLHFLVIGAAIFAGAHVLEQWKQAAQSQVIVDSGLGLRLASLYRTQFGVAPTPAQLRVIVDDYLDDEVVYREALRLGLDQDDEIIRRRLIQKLEFLQRDAVANTNPSPAELRAYYERHADQFAVGARVSFAQIFFNPDKGGDARALARAREASAQWQARREIADSDTSTFQNEYADVTRADATRLFGSSNLVARLFSQAPNDWSEPVRSGFGWHLVKVISVDPARVLPFEQVMPDVRGAYLSGAAARDRRQRLDDLRARYHLSTRKTSP